MAVPAFIGDPWSRAMHDRRAEIDEATTLVRWLLEAGLDGLGLTKTHALRRAVVREAAERWPHWWRHELFGPPHRESDLLVLAEVHAALRRLRLMRRRRETLLTTARGRELLADPEALVKLLHDDLGDDGFDGDAWLLIEEVLHEYGPMESDRLSEIVGRLLVVEGCRDADGAQLDGWALSGALQPMLGRAEGYGLPLAELDLHLGQRIGYVFDFGDEWRVRLTVRERVTAEPGDHPRVLELRGTPPPQYAALDDS